MISRFQDDPAGPSIFVLSLKAGGFGLNLTQARHVFHFDRWWNPAVEDQATDRVFRIGQTRSVSVYKYICAGTVEERIDELIEKKKELAGTGHSSGGGLADRAFHVRLTRSLLSPERCDPGLIDDRLNRRTKPRSPNVADELPIRPWWASRWISVLESLGLATRLERGRRYARSGECFASTSNLVGWKLLFRDHATSPIGFGSA